MKVKLENKNSQRTHSLVLPRIHRALLQDSLLTKPTPNFKLLQQLGKGAFAKVHLGRLQEELIAVKVYNKTNLQQHVLQNLLRQINSLSLVNHQSMVSLRFVHQDTKSIVIGMTLAKGDSLKSVLRGGKLDLCFARWVVKGILQGVHHMHEKGLAHRDIKLQNIVVDKKTQKSVLIDYGFSINVKGHLSFCGTPSYMAPQVIARKTHCPLKADIWSLGITIFAMLVGNFPFRGINQLDLYRKIEKGKYESKQLTKQCEQLVRGLLQVNPQKRMTAIEALSCIWLQ